MCCENREGSPRKLSVVSRPVDTLPNEDFVTRKQKGQGQRSEYSTSGFSGAPRVWHQQQSITRGFLLIRPARDWHGRRNWLSAAKVLAYSPEIEVQFSRHFIFWDSFSLLSHRTAARVLLRLSLAAPLYIFSEHTGLEETKKGVVQRTTDRHTAESWFHRREPK